MSLLQIVAVPLSAFNKVERILTIVVFPAPFEPSKANILPFFIA